MHEAHVTDTPESATESAPANVWVFARPGNGYGRFLLTRRQWRLPLREAQGIDAEANGPRHGYVTHVGALLLALSALAFLSLDSRVTYTAQLSGPNRVVLPDHSLIEQNVGSSSGARISPGARDLTLSPGAEVVVSVARDERVPFVIHAGSIAVQATSGAVWVRSLEAGAWRVGAFADSMGVHCRSGGGIRTITLRPGDIATFGPDAVRLARSYPQDVERHTAWRRSEIWLTGETLAEAAAEFNRYNQSKLVITDSRTASLRIGGRFGAGKVDKFVRALEPLGIKSRVLARTPRSNEVILLSRREP
jgi:transmembrane sensor